MNESDLKCIRKPTRSRLSLIHWPIQPLSRVKSLDGPRVRVISPVGRKRSMEERLCWRAKSWVQNEILSE